MSARGCGSSRTAGDLYLEVPCGPGGQPVEEFLICPPLQIPPDFTLPTRGMRLFEVRGVWHLADWVGSEHYPNVADYIEEVRRMGVSRKMPSNLDFGKITPESRILMAHKKAWVGHTHELDLRQPSLIQSFGPDCPKGHMDHRPSRIQAGVPCLRGAYLEVEGGVIPHPLTSREAFEGGDLVTKREMPGFTYMARRAPEGLKTDHHAAFFASFPIPRIVGVRCPDGSHLGKMERARKARGVEVAEVSE